MSLSIEIEGLQEIQDGFDDLSKADLKELKRGIVSLIRKDLEERFLTSPGTTQGGNPYPGDFFWKELSESYLQLRPDRASGQLLIDTGALRDSLVNENYVGSLVVIADDFIEFGTTLEYAAKQDELRPFLYVHDLLLDDIVQFIEDYILDIALTQQGTFL